MHFRLGSASFKEILLPTAVGIRMTAHDAGRSGYLKAPSIFVVYKAISHRTVEKHRENIRDKLYLDSRIEMVRIAFQYGLVEPPISESDDVPVEAGET